MLVVTMEGSVPFMGVIVRKGNLQYVLSFEHWFSKALCTKQREKDNDFEGRGSESVSTKSAERTIVLGQEQHNKCFSKKPGLGDDLQVQEMPFNQHDRSQNTWTCFLSKCDASVKLFALGAGPMSWTPGSDRDLVYSTEFRPELCGFPPKNSN